MILKNIPLKKYTTWGVGGPADYFAEPSDVKELKEAIKFARSEGVDVFYMGSGSNLLIHDSGFRGLVIRTTRMNRFYIDGNMVIAEAGVKLPGLARRTVELGLSGMEELAGIPGTVGGAIIQNAGAYGREIGELIEWIEILHHEKIERYPRDTLKFSYRKSKLPSEGAIVRAGLKLEYGDRMSSILLMRKLLQQRRKTQPRGKTAGSVFKNPAEGPPAGWLLEKAGVKGIRIGGAGYSDVHANFIVNFGDATAMDIYSLIRLGIDRVLDKFGIELSTEIEILGEFQ